MEKKADQHVYQCNLCSKEYTSKGSLTLHMRAHSGERPYACQVCKKSFSRSAYLSVHMKIHTGEKPHECNLCGRSFVQKGNLVKHFRNHTGEKPHICQVCKKSFAAKNRLQSHMRIHTGERPFRCIVCDKSFSHPGSLHSHMKIHIGERPFVCSVCSKSFIRKQDFQNHVRGVHAKSYSCAYCSKGYNRINSLNYHVSREHNNLKAVECKNHPHQCDTSAVCCQQQDLHCQSKSVKTDGEKANIKTVTINLIRSEEELADIVNPTRSDECFSCIQDKNSVVQLETPSVGIKNNSDLDKICEQGGKKNCNRSVDYNNQVDSPSVIAEPEVNIFRDADDHITIVINGNNLENSNNSGAASLCKMSSQKSESIPAKDNSLSSSLVTCAMGKKKRRRKSRRHKCSVCLRKFISSNSLNLHVRKKHPEWHKNISECVQNALETQFQMGIVRKIHCREKSLSCIICSKEQKSDLAWHLHSHSHNQCLSCELCGKSFSKQYHLNVHKRKHSGDKPYECAVCQKSFSQKGNLLTHMRIHTNEKPYVCDTCRKSFSLKSSLTDHVRIHTGERPYICLTCGKGFKRHPQLVRHARVHFSEQPYVCTVCNKTFKDTSSQKRHMKSHSSVNVVNKQTSEELKDVKIEFGNDNLSDCVKIELGVHSDISSSSEASYGNHISVISDVKTISSCSNEDTKDFFLLPAVKCLEIDFGEDIVQ